MELISVIKYPIYTEKAYQQAEGNIKKYTFAVHPNANRIMVRQAFKLIYNVNPIKVNILVSKPTRTKTGTLHPGVTNLTKIAIISVPLGVEIAVTGEKEKTQADSSNRKESKKE